MRRGIGVILEQERKKAGISLEVLCKGICSIGELNRIQNSEREPDKFLLDCLWARLGKGKEKLEIILSATDYFIYEMRNLIWKDFQNKNFAEMERKLCFYENMKEAQKPFHYQYICEIRALHAFQEKKEEALIEVKKAILYTIPDFPRDRFWECALSVDELRLVFLYFKITKQVDRKEKIRSYYKILNILEKKYFENEEKVRLYPEIVLELEKMTGDKTDLKKCCSYALEIMRREGCFFNLTDILSLQIEILKNDTNKKETVELLKKELYYLRKLCREFKIQEQQHVWIDFLERELYLDYELLHKSREAMNISQEQLSEEICTQEALSRIETNKNKARAKTFRQLSERLGKRGERCGACINAKDYEILRLERLEGYFMSYGRYDDAEDVFKKIEEFGLEKTKENSQYLLLTKTIFEIINNKISYTDSLIKLQEALKYTLTENELKNIESCFLTCQEAIILNNMAISYYRSNQKMKAIDLLKCIVKNFQNSKIELKYHTRALMPVLSNLASYLQETKDYDGALEICDKAIMLAFQVGKCNEFQRYITTKACVLESQQKMNESIECFTQAYYISYLMKDDIKVELIKKYLKETFSVTI